MIPERIWMRGKHLMDVDVIREGPFRNCRMSIPVDPVNLQNPMLSPISYSRVHQRPLCIRRNYFPIGCVTTTDGDRGHIHPSININMRVDTSVIRQDRYYNYYQYRIQQFRRIGINIDDASKNKSSANDQKSSSSENTVESKSNRGTDPAFVSYLTGDMKPQSILNELTKLSATSILNQRRTAAAKRSRSFALDSNNDKALYRQIIDFQILQKEKSHRKTAFNVNRALIGNVIICSGKNFLC